MTAQSSPSDASGFWQGRFGRGVFIAAMALIAACTLTVVGPLLFLMRFSIPAASMNPGLYIGDLLLASHVAYDSTLERGDVALFRAGEGAGRAIFIKRVIGLPGDRVAVKNGQLVINGAPVPRRKIDDVVIDWDGGFEPVPAYEETLPGGRTVRIVETDGDSSPFDNFAEVTVPDGHYFLMGDNRDNSGDSRSNSYFGFVPREDFVGKAKWIYFSAGADGVRFGRIGQRIR